MLRKTLRDNAFFFVPYLIVLLFLIPFLLLYSKSQIHLYINQYHTGFFDNLFARLTFLGDGLFIIVPVIILLFISLRHAVFIIASWLATGLVTQILKRLFFEDMLRPMKYFKDTGSLYLIDGIKMLHGRSFPSGHSTSAFALFLCLALISDNKYIKLLCFILSCLVAFSRVYLSQHFLIDIMAGSFIGCLGTLAIYQILYRNDSPWHFLTLQQAFKHEQKA